MRKTISKRGSPMTCANRSGESRVISNRLILVRRACLPCLYQSIRLNNGWGKGTSMSHKIAVLGTGANGSCIAANLVDAGLDVSLIDQWPSHVEAMRANGIRITMTERTLHGPVRAYHLCDVCTLKEMLDVVLLAMKAYDTRWACELIKSHLAPDGILIGMQNAMTAV